ncbi:MAG: hypothetical protein MST12_03410 [Spirochaetia bacterium]|mgnify:FL=1|uniref:hypothetical protein n=1 Tax=Treponema sp. TaxID=166 RepID=UPI00298E56A1|nr:hypothetical protein [Treponema sp.]MCI7398613.1 hypothetical protein [Spirochaetia bacterium]MCI7577282.1 hypothetical protein [Spirochaetia bacterium]
MKVLELHSITKEDGYIYYIHHYKAQAKIEFLANVVDVPISFTVEMNPLGIRTVDLDPLPKDIDYPVIPLNKSLKEFIDVMARDDQLPQT